MDKFGDREDVLLEDPKGVGDGEHDPGHGLVEVSLQGLEVHHAPPVRRDRNHLESGHGRGGRVRPVGGVGKEDFPPLLKLPTVLEIALDEEHAGELSVGAGRGLQRDPRHSRDPFQVLGKLPKHGQSALHFVLGKKGMKAGETGKPGKVLVEFGVVFHRTASQRVKAGVHAVVEAGKGGVMADELRLRNFGKPRRLPSAQPLRDFPEEFLLRTGKLRQS
jgi:hypothetical protein